MIFLTKDSMLTLSLQDPITAIFCSAALGCVTISLDFHLFEVASTGHHPYLLTHPDRSSRFECLLGHDFPSHDLLIYAVVELLVATSTLQSYLFYPSNAFMLRVECSHFLFILIELD